MVNVEKINTFIKVINAMIVINLVNNAQEIHTQNVKVVMMDTNYIMEDVFGLITKIVLLDNIKNIIIVKIVMMKIVINVLANMNQLNVKKDII